jgi:hypothetical protein
VESGAAIPIERDGLGDTLQRDVASALGIARAIHLAQTASPEGRDDFVRAEADAE